MKNKRLTFLFSILILLCISLACQHTHYQKEMGFGPAGPEVKINLTQLTTKKIQLLGLGDSVTKGFGAPTGYSYFELLAHNKDHKFPKLKGYDLHSLIKDFKYQNLATNCSDSRQHQTLQVNTLPTYDKNRFGIICLTTGGNDLIHNYGLTKPSECALYGIRFEDAKLYAESFKKRLHKMRQRIQLSFPGGCHLFIATIYDPTDGIGDIHNAPLPLPEWPDGLKCLTLYNKIIKEFATSYKDVSLVDVHAVMLGHGIHYNDSSNPHYDEKDPHYWYYINLEDPNARGYDAIRRCFLNKITEVIPKID